MDESTQEESKDQTMKELDREINFIFSQIMMMSSEKNAKKIRRKKRRHKSYNST